MSDMKVQEILRLQEGDEHSFPERSSSDLHQIIERTAPITAIAALSEFLLYKYIELNFYLED